MAAQYCIPQYIPSMASQTPLTLKSACQFRGYEGVGNTFSFPRYTRKFRHRSTSRGRTVIEREIDSPSRPLIRILGWRRETSLEVIEVLRMGCNIWALPKIVIMCVGPVIGPPTCLDSVPKTQSLPQPPPRALLAATPYTPTSARSQSPG